MLPYIAYLKKIVSIILYIYGGFRLSCRLEIWPKLADDLVNMSFKSCRNGEFRKPGDGDFAI